jgi:prepilin-type N-terminal cleavage/methylation domain-containing protein
MVTKVHVISAMSNDKDNSRSKLGKPGTSRQPGFTLIELVIVMSILLVVAGFAVPKMLNFIHTARLQGAGNDYSGVLQSARINAVHDDRYYSTYIVAGSPKEAYVDLTSNGGTGSVAGDPLIQISSEVVVIAAASASSTSNLKGQFLPAGSLLAVHDGSLSSSPVIFGPTGLPCTALAVTGGTICNNAGGATAFWVFFQDNITQAWEAITVTPAGRIQKWRLDGTSWTKL